MPAWKWLIKLPGGTVVRTAFAHAMSRHALLECGNYPAGSVLLGIDMSTAVVL